MNMDKVKQKVKELLSLVKERWNTPGTGRFINIKEFLSFAGTSLGVSMIVNVLMICLTANQISGTYSIPILHGTLICLAASILGLVLQPIFSKIIQNTHTKFGRYKPFILGIVPALAILGVLSTWRPESLESEQSRLIYCYLVCSPTLVLFYLLNNTFFMMPAVITPNQQERTDIWSPIGLVIGFAPTIINAMKGWIAAPFIAMGKEYLAYRYLGIISIVLGAVLILLILKVKERIVETVENNEKVGVFEGLKMMLKNKPLMIFTLALVLGCMRSAIEIDAEIIGRLRYASTIDTGIAVFSSLSLFTGFAVTPNMILLPFLTRKFNNKTIMIGWGAFNVIGYLVLGLVGIQNIPQGVVSATVITIMRFIALFNAVGTLQPLMLSEIYDNQQLLTGKRLEGFIQMFAYCLVLVCTNIGLLLLAVLKTQMGYEPSNYYNVTTVSDDLMNIATRYLNIALIISAISALLFIIVMLFYPLNKKKHAAIMEELKKISAEEHGGTAVLSDDDTLLAPETDISAPKESKSDGTSFFDE